MRFASFLSDGFITALLVNPPEKKQAKRICVQWCIVMCSTSSRKQVTNLERRRKTSLYEYILYESDHSWFLQNSMDRIVHTFVMYC
jgi:ribosomal silencing factor RsfS